MDEIDNLLNSMYLNRTIGKMKLSLDDIKQNNPNRLDLISSMQDTITELTSVSVWCRTLEQQNKILAKDLFNYQNLCLDLKIDLRELKKANEVDKILKEF